jgi:hypothetical protein
MDAQHFNESVRLDANTAGGWEGGRGPVLRHQKPFAKIWSKELYKIFYSVIRYLY